MSTTDVVAQASIVDDAPVRTVTFSLQDWTPASPVEVGGVYSIRGISDVQVSWSGLTATMTIRFKSPDTLAPGVYQDTISIMACTEWPCVNHIAGSPRTVAVTYTVTGITVSMNLSDTSVSVTANNLITHQAITNSSIRLTVTDPVSRQWLRTTTTNGVVQQASVALASSSQGTLNLTLRAPSSLGAGDYTDKVTVELCLNPSCSVQALGSPVTVNVSYHVTGDALPTLRVNWGVPPFGSGALNTADTRPGTMALMMSSSEFLYDTVYMRHGASTTGLIQDVSVVQNASRFESGLYSITLRPPAMLGSGVFTDSMEFEACLDAACAKPVPNSRYTLAVNVLVSATEGVEYTRRVMQVSGAREVTWSAPNQSLYLVRDSVSDHAITQVDPVTATVGASTNINQVLRNVAVTPDGSYLYVGAFSSFVYRLQLPSLQQDLDIPLGTGSVSDLATIAGQPQSIVVVTKKTGNQSDVVVFDNAVARPNRVLPEAGQSSGNLRWLVPAATPGSFISQWFVPGTNRLDQLVVDANGIGIGSSALINHQNGFARPERAGAKLFERGAGKVADASTGAIIGSLELATVYDLVVDEAHGRVFAWGELGGTRSGIPLVVSYDLATLAPLAYMYVSNGPSTARPYEGGKAMALWGNEGLALVNGNQLILLSGKFFSTYRGAPTL